MTFKKGIFIFSVVIILSLMINITYTGLAKMDEIMFFDHYISTEVSSDVGQFKLAYLTNSEDKRKINTIGLDDLTLLVLRENIHIIGPYKVVELTLVYQGEDLESTRKFKRVEAVFQDGQSTSQSVSLIELLPKLSSDFLEMHMVSSSNTGEFMETYKVESPMKVTEIAKHPQINDDLLLVLSEDNMHHRMEDVKPLSLAKLDTIKLPFQCEDYLTISAYIGPETEKIINICLQIETTSGTFYSSNFTHTPLWNYSIIKSLINSRRDHVPSN